MVQPFAYDDAGGQRRHVWTVALFGIIALIEVVLIGVEALRWWIGYTGDDSDPSQYMAVGLLLFACLPLAVATVGLTLALRTRTRDVAYGLCLAAALLPIPFWAVWLYFTALLNGWP